MLYSKHNSIKNSSVYDLQATSTSGAILALRNWWGESPPNAAQINTVNGVYYFLHLTADPIPADHTPAKAVARAPVKPNAPQQDRQEIIDLYAKGRQLMDEGHPNAAGKIFKEVLNQYPNSRLAPVALKELVGLYARQDDAKTARRLIRAASQKATTAALARAVERLEFDLLILEQRYEDALAASNQLAAADQDLNEELAFEAARLQRFELNRKTAGAQALRTYLNRFPAAADKNMRQVRRQVVHAMLKQPAEAEPTVAAKQLVSDTATILTIEGSNPFNPETTVAFNLTNPTTVELHVYNIAGQLVRHLINSEHRTTGRHRVRWDGTNDQGYSLASGVYLMRLEAGALADVRKLSLVR
jgi:tetratricopeptide (TPR) repeat protein